MKIGKRKDKRYILSFIFALVIAFSCIMTNTAYSATGTSSNTLPYSIGQAMANQNNTLETVQGYVVGQPTSIDSVLVSGYTGDTAIAIADNVTETSTSKMVYVQVPNEYRATFGLKTNSSLKGSKIKVTGYLTAYFTHAGVKNVSSITKEASSEDSTDNSTDSGATNTDSISTSYDNTYYAKAMGKTGTDLKSTLHGIISNNTKLSYEAVWNGIKDTDEDPNNSNNVILLYTGRSQAKNTNGSGVDNWNREHVWAKSHGDFGTRTGAGTDLHHLRATDVSVNSARGNLDFDNGGVSHSEATLCKYDSDSWEPRDSVKGDIARMLFYMAVRYEGDNGEPDLELNNQVNNGKAPYLGKISTLLQWNIQDPVDASEIRRNNIIYNKYQHNRNPFIDHPEWVSKIWN